MENKIIKLLPVKLTDDELIEQGNQLAKLLNDQAKIEGEKAEAMSSFKARLDALKANIYRISLVVSQRQEWRNVECEERKEYDGMMVHVLRLDNGEIVSSRKMTTAELQGDLPME